ncbi:hypothetical protein [Streptomyces sp. PTD5-9]
MQRDAVLRGRYVHDYSFIDWIHGPTALTPEEEPEMSRPVPLDSVPF